MKKSIFLLVVILLNSCTKELDYPLKDEPSLVLNAILTEGEPIIFHISTTASMLSTYNQTDSGFHLELYENNIARLDTIVKGGIFESPVKGIEFHNYKVKLSKDGFKTVYAEDTIPTKPYIAKALYAFDINVDKYGEAYGEGQVTFTDPINVKNYYEIVIESKEGTKNYSTLDDFLVTEPVLINEGDLDYFPTSYFFSDELFNGETYTIKLPGRFVNGSTLGNEIFFKLRNVSESYYLYRKYYTRHAYNQQFQGDFWTTVFMGEPQSMYSNIIDGYGIFSGYNEYTKSIKVEK